MRILFYLPVVTPWWFDSIIEPLVRRLIDGAEVHIIAPPPWSGTGISERERDRCADLPHLNWHIVDGESHPTVRTSPDDPDALVDLVAALAPDYVLCRSADCETVRGFPGVVRFLMEGGAAPLAIPPDWIVLADQPFDHGCMPALTPDDLAVLDDLIAPVWDRLVRAAEPSSYIRRTFRKWADLPTDRPVLTVPLEYEHAENFFHMHRVGATPNQRLIAELDAAIDDSFYLAFTNHPLNELYVDNHAVEAEIAAHGSRMKLLPSTTPKGGNTTMLLARDVQCMIVGDSKVYSTAAFFGTPMMRRTRFRTGPWLKAYADFDSFLPAVARGTAVAANQADARRWFAFHLANNVIDPHDGALTPAELTARIDRPVDPSRWANGIARYAALAQEGCR